MPPSRETPAFQYFEERQKGTLAPGKQADLVVLDRDPVVTDPAALCSIRVLRTVKGGKDRLATDIA